MRLTELRPSTPLFWALGLAILLPVLYLSRVDADSISGLFGVFWSDEGTYLLSAKHAVLFGQPHLFEGDRWRPELIAPLLHRFALHTITPEEPLHWVRFGIGLHVLAGAALIASIAGRAGLASGITCFLCILLNPVLFFYARVGLSEGLQFFILALFLLSLYRLSLSGWPRSLAWAALCGVLASALFISKISAVAACAGLSAGMLAALPAMRWPQKAILCGIYAIAALSVLYVYFYGIIGTNWPLWKQANLEGQAAKRVPPDIATAIGIFKVRYADIAYYLSLMPIFAFHLLALPIATRQRGFIFALAVATLLTIFLESFFGGDIRRNFFGLSLLSILGGFTMPHYWRDGVTWKLTLSTAPAFLLVGLHVAGMAFLLYWAATHADRLYIIFCAAFLALMLLAAIAPQPRMRGVLMAVALLTSLAPIIIGSLFTPRNREEVTEAIEAIVPPDAVIIGQSTPWPFAGLRRKLVFTNCAFGNNVVDFANSYADVPLAAHYYIGDQVPTNDPCQPPEFGGQLVGIYSMFNPGNYGGWRGTSDHWTHRSATYLYKQ